MKICVDCEEKFEDEFVTDGVCELCIKYAQQLEDEQEEAERHIYPDESLTDADRIVEEDDGDV